MIYITNPDRAHIGNSLHKSGAFSGMSILSKKHFHNEKSAFKYLESVLWTDGPICPHCGSVNQAYRLTGKATRVGLYKCASCRKQFRVTIGTVFEHLRIPLHKALQAVYLMTSSIDGISARHLQRTLGISYRSAWALSKRIGGVVCGEETMDGGKG